MKIVRLIPEASLLVIYDNITKEASLMQLPASQIRALAHDFEEAVLLLDQPSRLSVIEPYQIPPLPTPSE